MEQKVCMNVLTYKREKNKKWNIIIKWKEKEKRRGVKRKRERERERK